MAEPGNARVNDEGKPRPTMEPGARARNITEAIRRHRARAKAKPPRVSKLGAGWLAQWEADQ